ncbi:MAG: FecR domain-containing protein [Leptospiraceae bacterium]|nr:FecR domain-containing protein [Leptospiraceae bacterium]MCP5493675.1 FecR domain-containing protein [Leptospiraceae bacterium]
MKTLQTSIQQPSKLPDFLFSKQFRVNTGTILTIFLLALYLYWDSTRDPYVGDRIPIGKVTSTVNDIERKLGAMVVWKSIEQESIIYNYDTIRTDSNSKTTIELDDGTKVALKEDTIIYINRNPEKIDINFIQGEISVDTINRKKIDVEKINIVHGNEVVRLDKTHISILKPMASSSTELELKGGEANLEKDNKIIPLQKDEYLVSKKELTKRFSKPQQKEVSRISETVPSLIRIEFPKNNSQVDIANMEEFNFVWERKKDIDFYQIRLTRLSDRAIVFNKTVTGTKYTIHDFRKLKRGKYKFSVGTTNKSEKTIHTFEIYLQKIDPNSIKYKTPEKIYVE